MSRIDETIPEGVMRSLRFSGFPFQTRIRHEIKAHGWEVSASEYPWQDRLEKDSFLDIVATKGRLVLAIECKKTAHETFTFLLPLGGKTTGRVNDFRGALVRFFRGQGRANIHYETSMIQPESSSSEFCIVGKGNDQGRLLERDASMLVRAADAFTADRREHDKLPDEELPRAVLPVIVTNAEIYTVLYEPTQVSLNSGEYEPKSGDIERAPWVRFYKSFTAHDNVGERSVFVVNATSFGDFLDKLEIGPH